MLLSRRKFMAVSALGLANFSIASAGNRKINKRILLIAGPASHGFGEHEHPASCRLLADRLNSLGKVGDYVFSAEAIEGFPENNTDIDDFDAVIIYGDGAGKNPVKGRSAVMKRLIESKKGIGVMHWSLDAPSDQRREIRDAIGGVFVPGWSINPVWTASLKKIPAHPVTSGVNPFTLKDEWYYHMKFVGGLKNVTSLINTLPPVETLVRADGPYSNNTYVRKAVLLNKEPQHLAWTYTRPSGGRGFGFAGGHWHWNWAHDDFRKLVMNAAIWLTGAEVLPGGIPSKTPDYDELLKNLGTPPQNFNHKQLKDLLTSWK